MELNAFGVVDLPAAALVLAQGAGRLIRTRDDHGVVAVLDSRLATRDYRVQLLQAMPPFKRSVDLDEACRFLEHATASTPPSPDPNRLKAPAPVEHTGKDVFTIRDTTPCPTCGAEAGARCKDENGFTMAFLHDARMAASREQPNSL